MVRSISLPALLALTLTASAQWSDDPTKNAVVTEEPNNQYGSRTAAAPDGMTWVAWLNRRANGHEIRLQLLDQAGVRLLPAAGLLVRDSVTFGANGSAFDMLTASDGSCVVVCTDGLAGSPVNVYAHRVDTAGDQLWGIDGVQVATDDEVLADREPSVIETSQARFAIAWSRFDGATTTTPGDLRMQLLDANGTPLLGPEGIVEPGTPFEKPGRCELAATPDGGWILAWVRSTQAVSSVANLHARRYASDGSPLWPAPVVVADGAPLFFGDHPRILADGTGGAVLAWQGWIGGMADVRVQRLDPQGVEVYPHDGVLASVSAGLQEFMPVLQYDEPSGEPTVWFSVYDASLPAWGISGQRFSSGGARLWGDAGKVVEPLDGAQELELTGEPYGDGALLFALQKLTIFFDTRIVALRVDALGDAVWSPAATLLSEWPGTTQGDLASCVTSAGVGVATWSAPTGVEPDVLAQNLNPDGSLGLVSGCSTSVYCLGAPNSVGNGATLGASGAASVGFGEFTLEVGSAPPGKLGIFVMGDSQAQTPFGDGTLCIGGSVLRLLPPSVVAPDGTAAQTLDHDAFPADQIAPGSTWNFQFWYRDPAGPLGSGFNLSDGLSVTFCP